MSTSRFFGLRDFHAHSVLKSSKVCRAQGICLSHYGDEVDPGAQTLHDFNIQRLKGVTGGSDEVETGMNSKVDFVDTTRLLFLEHVGLMLII